MKYIWWKSVVATGLVAGAGFMLPSIAHGATQYHPELQIAPAIIEQNLTPPALSPKQITVTNLSDKPMPIAVTVKGLVPEGDVQEGNRESFDASAWFKLNDLDTNFILEPHASRVINFSIAAPAGAEAGGHYATMYFESLVPVEQFLPNEAHVSARVGALALLTVPGKTVTAAKIEKDVSTKAFSQFGPFDFNFKLANTGNIHFLPSGGIVIRDSKGRHVTTLPLEPGIVLPKTARQYALTWDKRFILGKYTATAELDYGPSHHKLVGKPVEFMVVPGITLGLLLLLAIGIVVAAIVNRHRWSNAIAIVIGREVIYRDHSA